MVKLRNSAEEIAWNWPAYSNAGLWDFVQSQFISREARVRKIAIFKLWMVSIFSMTSVIVWRTDNSISNVEIQKRRIIFQTDYQTTKLKQAATFKVVLVLFQQKAKSFSEIKAIFLGTIKVKLRKGKRRQALSYHRELTQKWYPLKFACFFMPAKLPFEYILLFCSLMNKN